MKRNNINRIFKIGLLALLVAIIGTSCVKSVENRTDFSDLTPYVLIPEGGMQNFGSGALLFNPLDDSATTTFHINYAATDVASQDESITIGIDQDALAAYNALGGNQYSIFPDSIYEFPADTTIIVKKGTSFSDAITLLAFPSKIDLLQNYMLPISIKTTPAGSSVSSNFKTIYYHLIGNPIAGVYYREWTRYNTATQTPPPSNHSADVPTPFAPIDGLTVQAESGSAGILYVISFTQVGTTLSDFTVSFNAASVAASGVTITGGPTIIEADPITGTYEFNYTYDNGAGGLRNITDRYTK